MCLFEKPNPRQTLLACKGVFYFNGDVNSGVNIWRHEKMRGLCIFYRHADECLYIADKYLPEDEDWNVSGVNLYAKLVLGQKNFGRGVIGLQCPWWEQTFSEKFCCESYEHYLEARNVELKNEAQQLRLEMQANTSGAQDLQQQNVALQGQMAAMEASMGQMALEKQKLERELMDARSLAASTPASTAPPSWSTASTGMTVEQEDRLLCFVARHPPEAPARIRGPEEGSVGAAAEVGGAASQPAFGLCWRWRWQSGQLAKNRMVEQMCCTFRCSASKKPGAVPRAHQEAFWLGLCMFFQLSHVYVCCSCCSLM